MTTPTFQFSPGQATFGLALEQGFARWVKVGALQTQVDVKTSWPDGTIRFCIVTATIVTAGSYDITPAPVDRGTPFVPTWPAVAVSFGALGVVTLPAFTPSNAWLSGSLVSESRIVLAPGSHPLLQVILDLRSYAAGGHRVDVTVQNVRNIAAGAIVNYDINITISGASVFARTGLSHQLYKRWRRTFTTGGLVESQVTPDFESAYRSGILPRYIGAEAKTANSASRDLVGPVLPAVSPAAWPPEPPPSRWPSEPPLWAPPDPPPAPPPSPPTPTPNTSSSGIDVGGQVFYEPLTYADMSEGQGAPGGRPELACYPQWTAQYLVQKTQALRAGMLARANCAGSWSGQIMEPDGVTLHTLDRHPNYWHDSRSPYPDGPAAPQNQAGSRIDATHVPSLSHVPYVVTGDRFYLDQQKMWANTILLQTYTGDAHGFGTDTAVDSNRKGAMGLLAPYSNEPRGFGWGLRELVDAAVDCPDTDPDKAYFTTRVQNNLDWLDAYAKRPAHGFINPLFWEFDPGTAGHPGYYSVSMWMNNYLTWAVDHAALNGFGPTDALRTRAVKAMVTLMTPSGAYNQYYGASLWYPRIGRWANGGHVPFQTIQEFFTANYSTPADILDGLDPNIPRGPGAIGIVGPEYRIYAVLGARDGIPGAQAMLDWCDANGLTGAGNWGYQLARFSGVSVVPPVTPPPTGGPMVVTFTIRTANEDDANHADNSASVTITPKAAVTTKKAEQNIKVSVSNATPTVGDQVVITGTWENKGPDTGTGDTALVDWPAGLVYLSHIASQGSYDPVSRIWTVGDVIVGVLPTLALTAKIT